MRSAISRALRLLSLIVVIPGACLVAVLLYGKALTDAQVAEASLPDRKSVV